MAKGRLRKVLSHARLNWQIIRYRLARWRNDLLSKEDHCVVFDRNWLARLFKEMSRHKEKWQT